MKTIVSEECLWLQAFTMSQLFKTNTYDVATLAQYGLWSYIIQISLFKRSISFLLY